MVLAAVAVVALAGSIGGLSLVRFYDDQLIRQTEGELLAQGAAVAEFVASEFERHLDGAVYGVEATMMPAPQPGGLTPVQPSLRATDPVLPSPPLAPTATAAPDPVCQAATPALSAMLVSISRTTLAGIRVLDVNGVVIAASQPELVGTAHDGRLEFQRALAGEAVSVLRERPPSTTDSTLEGLSRSNAIRVVVAMPVLRHGRVWAVVLLVRTPMTLAKAVYGDRTTLGATSLVLLGVIGLLVIGLSIAIVRPVRALVLQTRAIASGDTKGSQPIIRPRVAELFELSTSLTTMAELLERRAQAIQSFTSSVSHEFKTPLAAMHGALELLRHEHDALAPDQRRRFLDNLAADVERLTRLVERLMLLARADSTTASQATVELTNALQAFTQPRVVVAVPVGLVARMPEAALTAAVGHVIENGLAHAGPDATVSVTARAAGDRVVIDVRDDGRGISEANARRIFEPFFTTARATGGTGLGLSIAATLLKAFGGSIRLEPGARGAHFVIELVLVSQ